MSSYDQLSPEQLEGQLAQYQKNLNHVQGQISQSGGPMSASVELINKRDAIITEIELIQKIINQKKSQTSSIAKFTNQSTISSLNPSEIKTKEVQLIIEGNINQVDDLYIKKLKYKLSVLLDLDISQIIILRYFSGSIRFIIEIPADSAQKLLNLYLLGTLKVEGFKVKEVTFEPHTQIGEKSTQPKPELTEPKAMIRAAWIGAAAVIIAAIIGIFKFMPNDTFNYQVEVLDNTTNQAISQAKVSITLPNLASLEAFSDNNGFARIAISAEYNKQEGLLKIEKANYDTAIFNVDIQADRLPKQIKLTPNQSNNPQPTATEAAAAAPTEPPTAGGATASKLIGCWNNDEKPRNITNINIRESAGGIKVGFKANCADSEITDEQDAIGLDENEIGLIKVDETWTFSLRPDGTLRLAIEGQTGFEELTFYKK